tara:strand:- start:394 stop:633 length:240 start_codon:yes stop_codon:yes gene_type:complete
MLGPFVVQKIVERHHSVHPESQGDYEFLAMEIVIDGDTHFLVSSDNGTSWKLDRCANFYHFAGGITYLLPIKEDDNANV